MITFGIYLAWKNLDHIIPSGNKNIQLQKYILKLSNKALATSGSYRKLKKIGKEEIIQKVNPNKFFDIQFHYVNQSEQNGLGHAILEAED